jgi:hypothetical protein
MHYQITKESWMESSRTPLPRKKKMGLFHLTGLTESIGFCEGYNQWSIVN